MKMNDGEVPGIFSVRGFAFSLQLNLRFNFQTLILGHSLFIETIEHILELVFNAAVIL